MMEPARIFGFQIRKRWRALPGKTIKNEKVMIMSSKKCFLGMTDDDVPKPSIQVWL